MQLLVELPTNIECDWVIHDADGKKLLASQEHPGIVLTILPYFYKGSQSQVVGRLVTKGAKGEVVRQILRVAGSDGKCSVISCDKKPKRVTPKFDALIPSAERVKKGLPQ